MPPIELLAPAKDYAAAVAAVDCGADAHYMARPLHVGRSSGVAEAQAVGHDGRVALVARLTAYR